MKTLKSKQARSQITVLNQNELMEKPSAYPTLPVLGKIAKGMGIDIISKKIELGFVLNARDPVAPGKARLIVPENKYMYKQNYYKPFYYGFNQWAFVFQMIDAIWGKVTIRFERGYLQDGIIFLRVGGFLDSMLGRGYNIFDGKSNVYVPSKHGSNDYGKFISQTIPVLIQKSANRSALLDITITSKLASWKFFDAKYSPLVISKPVN
ncbi:MAG: hypothetical protein JSS91_02210 [Bacteroidetes bacterium]|nr:hypothetical protein [Bacteroidota bacterium]